MRGSIASAIVGMLILLSSCARQYSTALEVTAEKFSREDCEAFVSAATLAASKLQLAQTSAVPDDHFGHSYVEFASEGVPVSIAVFCDQSLLQVRTTSVGRDPAGIAKQPKYLGATSDLDRQLTKKWGSQLQRRDDSVKVRWWPWGNDA